MRPWLWPWIPCMGSRILHARSKVCAVDMSLAYLHRKWSHHSTTDSGGTCNVCHPIASQACVISSVHYQPLCAIVAFQFPREWIKMKWRKYSCEQASSVAMGVPERCALKFWKKKKRVQITHSPTFSFASPHQFQTKVSTGDTTKFCTKLEVVPSITKYTVLSPWCMRFVLYVIFLWLMKPKARLVKLSHFQDHGEDWWDGILRRRSENGEKRRQKDFKKWKNWAKRKII